MFLINTPGSLRPLRTRTCQFPSIRLKHFKGFSAKSNPAVLSFNIANKCSILPTILSKIFSPFCSLIEIFIEFWQIWVSFTFYFNVIYNWDFRNFVKAIVSNAFTCPQLIGKVFVLKVTIVNPPTVFIPMLIFCPSF